MMSSSNPTFVKTHARRRPSRSGANVTPPPSDATLDQTNVEFRLERMTPPPEQGTVQVDPTVADSAEIWIDSVENEILRADDASSQIPRPHVSPRDSATRPANEDQPTEPDTNPITTGKVEDDAGQVIDASCGDPSQSIIERLESLQHQFDTTTPMIDSISIDVLAAADTSDVAELIPTDVTYSETTEVPSVDPSDLLGQRVDAAEDVIQSARQRLQDVQQLVDEVAEPEPVRHSEDDTETTESTAVNVTQADPTADSSTAIEPFQAAWEVDVFDIPQVVGDLFFEGQLFHQIAEQMLNAVNSGLKSVMVTSVHNGEGRSSVAIGVAMAAAAARIRVAIVDLDTQNPTLADDLRLDLEYGWTESLRLGLPIKEVAVHAVDDGVTLIPLLNRGSAPTGEEVHQVIELLKSRFELIIIDGPSGGDALVDRIANSVDSAIVVHRPVKGDAVLLNSLCERLDRAQIQGIGLVENFA